MIHSPARLRFRIVALSALALLPLEARADRTCTRDHERAVYVMPLVQAHGGDHPDYDPRHLGRLLLFHCFVFPYAVSDQGYVLTSNDRYGPWDRLTDAQVADLQRRRQLPDPLPPWRMSWSDRLFGHLLWGVLLLTPALLWLRRRLEHHRASRNRRW